MIPAQDPFAAYQPSDDEPDQPTAQEKSSTNRKVAVLVGGTTLVGASLAGLAWGMSRSDPEETSVALPDDDLRIDKEGAIRTVADSANTAADEQLPTVSLSEADISTADISSAGISTAGISSGNDDGSGGSSGQGFSDAFRSARDEMGAGKFFTWHGNLYSTNFKEEWEAKPEDEQKTYFSGMGLAEADLAPAADESLPDPDDAPVSQALVNETEVEDGIPVSIEELKNAEFSSDKITIVDAVTIQDGGDNLPVAIESATDKSDADEWIRHEPGQFTNQTDSEMDSFSMPQYSSSMTDGLSSDDDDQETD